MNSFTSIPPSSTSSTPVALTRTPFTPAPFTLVVRNQLWFVSRNWIRTALVALCVAIPVFLAAIFAARVPVLHGRNIEGGAMALQFEWFAESDFGMPDAPGLLAVFLAFLVVLFVALLRPFSMWAGEAPRERAYFWLLPVARWRHELARLVAGAVLLLAAIVGMAAIAALGLVIGGHTGALHALTRDAAINFVTGPLTVYLLSSAAVIGSDRPGRALLIAWMTITIPYIVFGLIDAQRMYQLFDAIAGGPYSYSAALVGGFIDALSQGAGATAGSWPLAAALWLALSLGVAAWSVFRRRNV